jgi:hypothetical protein
VELNKEVSTSKFFQGVDQSEMKPVKVVCHDKTAGVSLARIHGNTCKII